MERATIAGGEALFAEVGCGSCHTPDMVLDDPVFTEPSLQAGFTEPVLPSGVPAAEAGLSAATAIRFDVTTDSPNNRLVIPVGGGAAFGAYPLDEAGYAMLGGYPRDAEGRAVIQRYSDFRLHDMGPGLADPVDAYGIGASVWPTRGLAGVGSTGPWLHDGRATTLDEAILAHGGEAADSRNRYAALPESQQSQIVAFLENLVIVDLDPEEEEEEH
jgi:cytochrome c peroxidase